VLRSANPFGAATYMRGRSRVVDLERYHLRRILLVWGSPIAVVDPLPYSLPPLPALGSQLSLRLPESSGSTYTLHHHQQPLNRHRARCRSPSQTAGGGIFRYIDFARSDDHRWSRHMRQLLLPNANSSIVTSLLSQKIPTFRSSSSIARLPKAAISTHFFCNAGFLCEYHTNVRVGMIPIPNNQLFLSDILTQLRGRSSPWRRGLRG